MKSLARAARRDTRRREAGLEFQEVSATSAPNCAGQVVKRWSGERSIAYRLRWVERLFITRGARVASRRKLIPFNAIPPSHGSRLARNATSGALGSRLAHVPLNAIRDPDSLASLNARAANESEVATTNKTYDDRDQIEQTANLSLQRARGALRPPGRRFHELAAGAIPLQRRDGGQWMTTVAIQPGEHHYRFIVDGEWRDDPQCTLHAPNPFGSQDMVANVA